MTDLPIDIPYTALAEFCQQKQIIRLALFGSVLRDDFNAESDVDVLVEFHPDAVIGLDFITIQDELSDLLGRRVDLNTYGFLSQHFREKVLTLAEVLYERTG